MCLPFCERAIISGPPELLNERVMMAMLHPISSLAFNSHAGIAAQPWVADAPLQAERLPAPSSPPALEALPSSDHPGLRRLKQQMLQLEAQVTDALHEWDR